MTKRPSLFSPKGPEPVEPQPEGSAPSAAPLGQPAAAAREAVSTSRWQKAATREGKRAVTAYIAPEAFRQLKRVAADEDAQMQDLMVEAINAIFEKRGLSRIA